MAATEHLNIPTYEQFAQLLTHIGVIAESMDIVEYEQEMSYTAEAWAVGTKNGIDVGSSDPQFHNNSKYYAEQAEAVAESIPEDYSELSDDVDQLKNALITDTASGTIASFPDGADNFPMRDLTVQMEPIQEGSGDPSPTNIRPISGRTGVTVTRMGKNLINPALSPDGVRRVGSVKYENGDNEVTFTSTTNNNYSCLGIFYFLKAGTYAFKYSATSSDSFNPVITFFSNSTVVKSSIHPNNEVSFTLSEDLVIEARMFVSTNGDGIVGRTVRYYNMQLELGSTATAYEPYQGQTYPVTFHSEAGTVYGGTVDVTTGVLTVDRASVTANNNISVTGPNTGWTNQKTYGWVLDNAKMPPSVQKAPEFLECSHGYKVSMDNIIWSTDMTFRVALNVGYAYMPIDSASTVSEAKQWMIDNNIQLVYELATPITYTLTPQQVTTLLGQNNIWSDADSISVEYVADTKLYIDKGLESVNTLRSSIAPVEDGATASQAYAQGKYFFHNGDFCKAKTAIASGATFTLNTNYEVTTVAAELYAALH